MLCYRDKSQALLCIFNNTKKQQNISPCSRPHVNERLISLDDTLRWDVTGVALACNPSQALKALLGAGPVHWQLASRACHSSVGHVHALQKSTNPHLAKHQFRRIRGCMHVCEMWAKYITMPTTNQLGNEHCSHISSCDCDTLVSQATYN